MEARHSLSGDDILAYRQQSTCTLDRNVRDLVSQLRLHRRGCRAGASYRRRLQGEAPLTATSSSTVDARGIPVVIGCRRQNRNVNKRREARTSVLQRVRRSWSRNTESNHSTLTMSSTAHIPSLYVLNAAALSKPHAVEHLATDDGPNGYDSDIAVIVETHFKSKHTDGWLCWNNWLQHLPARS